MAILLQFPRLKLTVLEVATRYVIAILLWFAAFIAVPVCGYFGGKVVYWLWVVSRR